MKLLLLSLALMMAQWSFSADIDLNSSYVQWTGSKLGGDSHTGKIKFQEGTLNLKGDKIEGGKLIVNFKNITVEDIKDKEKAGKLIGHLTNGDFFDTGKFPTAEFTIKSVKENTVTGDLKIKDKTHPATITFTQKGKTFTGKFNFDRTKFGVVYASSGFFKELAAERIIKDDIQLEFNVVVK